MKRNSLDNYLKIIVLLRKNSRTKLASMSRQLGMPISSLFERMKALNKEIIQRHTVCLDFARLGFPIHVYIAARAEENSRDGFRSLCLASLNTNSLMRISGDYNYLLDAYFAGLGQLDSFIEGLARVGIRKYQLHYVVEECKREDFLCSEEQLNFLS